MPPQTPPQQDQPNQWQANQEQPVQPQVFSQAPEAAPSEPKGLVSWSASEFIAYQKNTGWYMTVLLAVLALATIVFFATGHDIISTVSIVVVGVLFMVFSSRKPRVLNYAISEDGIHIGDKLYPFSTLKSFAVVDEGMLHSIALMPIRRFMPAVSMYCEAQDEAQIVGILGSFLPQEERKQEIVDRFMHKIRF